MYTVLDFFFFYYLLPGATAFMDTYKRVQFFPKDAWPELLGWNSQNAINQILCERPELRIYITTSKAMPMTYLPNRVVLKVDPDGYIVDTPTVG